MYIDTIIVLLIQLISLCVADHYEGGTIVWRPVDPYSITGPIEIIIEHRQTFVSSRYLCNQSTIYSYGTITDDQNAPPPALICISSSALCTVSLYQIINSSLICDDVSSTVNYTSGSLLSTQTLALNTEIDIAWRGAAWIDPIYTNSFSLVSHISLTPLNSGKINSSPVTGSVPVFRAIVNVATSIPILATDWDNEQVVRCRWSNQVPTDECGNVCLNLPGATLSSTECVINWTPVLRSEDIANGLTQSTYVVAISVEDFANASSNIPISKTPHQMLIQVYTPPMDACPTPPSFQSYPHQNLGCFYAGVNTLTTFQIRIQVNCPNDSIVEMTTLTPFGMNRSSLFLYPGTNNTWAINFRWIPAANQTGVQPFCIAGIDNHGVSTIQYCIAFAVGSNISNYYQATSLAYVQGTWSPVGTVMSTVNRFSIQTTMPLKRPMRNGSDIVILYPNGTWFWAIDARYSPDVFFINNLLVFYVRGKTWNIGQTYYVYLYEGVATADQACGVEAPAFSNRNNWRFTIWDASMSSTTTVSTTTSTPTTVTVTTRTIATTTANTLYTTTGIPVYTTLTTTSTTSTTSTSVTTTTTTSATTTTTTTTTTTEYIPNAVVIYPKDMELTCRSPIIVATAVIILASLPLHIYAMITLFTTMNSNLQKDVLKVRNALHRRPKTTLSSFDFMEEQSFV